MARSTRQNEFIYLLEGVAALITDAGETELRAGMCAGFAAGGGDAHHSRATDPRAWAISATAR